MDRNNESLNSRTIADKKMSFTSETKAVKRETATIEKPEEDYPEWKEGYLAEIYLAERKGDHF